jgi:hypothetical protein
VAGRIYVVYARTATGLKLWPLAVFCNSEAAAADARAYAAAAVAEGKRVRAAAGSYPVARTEVRDYLTWAQVPALSKSL